VAMVEQVAAQERDGCFVLLHLEHPFSCPLSSIYYQAHTQQKIGQNAQRLMNYA